MVGGIIGIRHQEHIVLLGLRSHGIIADDDLPVAAPVVPADHNGLALCQPVLDVLHPDAVRIVGRCLYIKTAYAVEDVHSLVQRGPGIALQLRAVQGVAQLGQGLLVPVAQLVVPLQHHQGRGDAAGPLAGLLLGLEVVEDRQGIRGLHVVNIRVGEVRRIRMVSLPLHRVRAVLRGQVRGIGDFHLIAEIFSSRGGIGVFRALGVVSRCVIGAAGQKSKHQQDGERQGDCFFHCRSPFRGVSPYPISYAFAHVGIIIGDRPPGRNAWSKRKKQGEGQVFVKQC